MDTLSKARRSENMRRIQSKDTKPEMRVRRLLTKMGYRYRLHRKDLPGKPDLVFASRKKVLFVHGCFWHQHAAKRCRIARLPKSNRTYWVPKLERNARRGAANVRALRRAGWRVAVVWECHCRNESALAKRLRRFLGPPGRGPK